MANDPTTAKVIMANQNAVLAMFLLKIRIARVSIRMFYQVKMRTGKMRTVDGEENLSRATCCRTRAGCTQTTLGATGNARLSGMAL